MKFKLNESTNVLLINEAKVYPIDKILSDNKIFLQGENVWNKWTGALDPPSSQVTLREQTPELYPTACNTNYDTAYDKAA